MPGESGQNRTMKAWVLHGVDNLRFENQEIPCTQKGDALVRVRAAGICGSDIPRIFETGAHVHPIVPGHEFSGEVVECDDRSLIGKRVGVFPLIPCEECPQCKQKQYQLCRNYNYLGSRCDGGFAEYVKVPIWNLIELPEAVTFPLGACLEPLSVAIHAIRRASITEADSVAVIGLGPIGLFAVIALLSMGIKRIYAVGNKFFQRNMVLHLGLPAEDYISSPLLPPESDVVLECTGKPDALAAALRSAAPNGRIVTVGNPDSNMPLAKSDYWRILRSQLTILGTWNSSFTHTADDDWHIAMQLLERNLALFTRMITHQIPLDQLNSGLDLMRRKKEPYCKIVVTMEAEMNAN